MKETELFVKEVRSEGWSERRVSKAQRASSKTYDCDSIMWTDDMGVFLKHDTPHSNDHLYKAL